MCTLSHTHVRTHPLTHPPMHARMHTRTHARVGVCIRTFHVCITCMYKNIMNSMYTDIMYVCKYVAQKLVHMHVSNGCIHTMQYARKCLLPCILTSNCCMVGGFCIIIVRFNCLVRITQQKNGCIPFSNNLVCLYSYKFVMLSFDTFSQKSCTSLCIDM